MPGECTQLLSMSFVEIHAALAADQSDASDFSAAGTAIVIRSALSLLTRIIGLPLAAIELPPPSLSIRFPKDRVPEEAACQFGRELTRYLAWRRVVLDLQLLATRRVVDVDPWDTLRRVTRLTIGSLESDTLHALGSRMDGCTPGDLTRERLIALQDRMSGHQRFAVRRACTIIDQLHAHELARELGILPPPIGKLPEKPRTREHLPLPPGIAAFAAEADVTIPAAHCWTLAVRAGLVSADADPVAGEWSALRA